MSREDITKDKLLRLLAQYGEHRWKCAVTRAIFQRKLAGTCNCGWQEICQELKLWEIRYD